MEPAQREDIRAEVNALVISLERALSKAREIEGVLDGGSTEKV